MKIISKELIYNYKKNGLQIKTVENGALQI